MKWLLTFVALALLLLPFEIEGQAAPPCLSEADINKINNAPGADAIYSELLKGALEHNDDEYLDDLTARAGRQLAEGGFDFDRIKEIILSGEDYADLRSALKKAGLSFDIAGELNETRLGFLTGGWKEATAQALGAIAKIFSGIAIGAASAVFVKFCVATAGVLCAVGTYIGLSAPAVWSILGVGGEFERFIEDKIRYYLRPECRRSGRGGRGGRGSSSGVGSGAVYQGNIDIDTRVGDVNTRASRGSSAITDVGVARGGNVKINAKVGGDVNTTASNRSGAYTGVGVATGDDSRISVRVQDDVNTSARNRSHASTVIGRADGGRVQVRIQGANTIASGSGNASTEVGTSTGGSVSATVGGTITTQARRGASSSTRIGVNQSAHVKGDVINRNGDLSVGGACAARRDGKCCIEIHRRLCVLMKVPPDKKGRCPPRFERWGAMCYRYSDKRHRIDR